MRALRSAAFLFLLAALVLPVLAFGPGLMHVFDTPKSAALELCAVLGACLALAGEGGRADPLARPWWLLWALMALAAAWLSLVTFPHTLFVGNNLHEFPAWFRFKQWLFHHWAFGLNLSGDAPGDRLFRAVEGLAALTLAERAWRSRAARDPILGVPGRLALALAALWFLSEAFSLRPDLASPELLDWSCYPLVFAAVWMLARDGRKRGRILAALLFAGALTAAYGLEQSTGHDFFRWAETFNGRAAGFFGNPDYLGGHLALLLPLDLALALGARTAPRRVLLWGLVVLFAAALAATRAWGAWVGAAAGCAVALACLRRADPDRFRPGRRLWLGLGAGLAVALAGLWLAATPSARGRLGEAWGGRGAEVGQRVFLMEKTIQLADGHPLLGVGPANFRLWFPTVQARGLDPRNYLDQPYTVSEHGHNDFLQMAADAGWPAALVWAALCASVFWLLFLGLGRVPAEDAALLAGCLGALTGLRVHGLTNFPFLVVPTEATGWALAALGLGLLRGRIPGLGWKGPLAPAVQAGPESGPVPDGPPAAPVAAAGKGSGPARRWLLVAVLAAAALVWMRARQYDEEGLWWVGAGELGLGHARVAASFLMKGLSVDPREDRLWDLHGQSQFDQGNIWDSIGSLREAHRLSPYDPQTALRLGLALIENRIYDEAYTVLRAAATEAPNYPDLWEPLMAAGFQTRRYEDAVQACDWMLYYHVHEEDAYTNKAAALGNLGRLQEAWQTLLEAQQRLPDSGKVQVNLAITLLKMGLRRAAIQAWRRAAALIPSDPQVDQLRKVLKP